MAFKRNAIDIDGYHILNELGRGGMATVYRAHHIATSKEVALKVSHSEVDQRNFIKEIDTLTLKLPEHKHIIKIFEIGIQESMCYYAMELIKGGTLHDKIKIKQKAQERWQSDEVLEMISAIGSALSFAHNYGVIHCDLKPSNILIREQTTEIVLADFGIARLQGEKNSDTAHKLIGSRFYMSPERFDVKSNPSPIPAWDFYSLGVILYNLLEYRYPYQGNNTIEVMFQHINSPIPKLAADYKDFQPLIEKLLHKNNKKRISEYGALAEEVNNLKKLVGNKKALELGDFNYCALMLDKLNYNVKHKVWGGYTEPEDLGKAFRGKKSDYRKQLKRGSLPLDALRHIFRNSELINDNNEAVLIDGDPNLKEIFAGGSSDSMAIPRILMGAAKMKTFFCCDESDENQIDRIDELYFDLISVVIKTTIKSVTNDLGSGHPIDDNWITRFLSYSVEATDITMVSVSEMGFVPAWVCKQFFENPNHSRITHGKSIIYIVSDNLNPVKVKRNIIERAKRIEQIKKIDAANSGARPTGKDFFQFANFEISVYRDIIQDVDKFCEAIADSPFTFWSNNDQSMDNLAKYLELKHVEISSST
ncbi:MAG: serine/threonine-protein kinase [Candidatus Competibacterales bacterium]